MITPYRMCRKYANQKIDRNMLKEFLVSWDYEPSDVTDSIDTLLIEVSGSWSEVEQAHFDGLIDDTLYDEVLDALVKDEKDAPRS